MSLLYKISKGIRHPLLSIVYFKNLILHHYRLYILKDESIVAVNKWYRDGEDVHLRFNYPLTSESIVFDLGGYKGDFAARISEKYNCHVYVYEPVKSFYLHCLERFEGNNKIKCFNYGLSNENGSFFITDESDASSLIKINNKSHNCEKVFVKIFSDEMMEQRIDHIDLLKINIEGPEFLILPHIFSKDLMTNIKHLQVQFHTFYPNAISLRNEIREKLSETHLEDWNYPFVWESWTRKV